MANKLTPQEIPREKELVDPGSGHDSDDPALREELSEKANQTICSESKNYYI
jgi:hypothetical protein